MPRRKQGFTFRSHEGNVKRKRVQEEQLESDSQEGQESSVSSKNRKKVRWGSGVCTIEDNEEDDSEQDASVDKICLAASCQFGRIGCAYYDPVKCTIYVFEDTPENQHFDLTRTLLEQANADIVLTSSKADDNFMDALRDRMDASGGVFQIRPHKDFSPVKGRDRVLSLRLLSELPPEITDDRTSSDPDAGSEPRNAYDFMRHRRQAAGDPTIQTWNASIRLSNYTAVDSAPLCLGSVGALLDHLARVRAVRELEDEGVGGLEIRSIEALIPEQAMQINADALFSLQVFEDESHASIHSDKTKEGLSLFGILNNTKTTLGRALLREWLLRPSLLLSVISARHDAVACFLRPENLVTAGAMHAHLKGIKNIPRILGVMRAGRAKVSDWQGLVKFTFHILMLRDALAELSQAIGVEIVKKLIDALEVASFREVGSVVNETIDWEESANADRVCVRPHIDEELDNLKHIYHGIDSVLSKVAQTISATVPPDYASSLNVVYFPQLGFLICVPMLEEWKTEAGITILEGWSFQFSSDSHVYFKSQEMHDMDTHIGDLHPSIVDREIEIVQSLQDKVLVYDKAMGHACDVCAELDCLLSFAEAARAGDYRRPRMVEENIIDIKQGRHPLQELVVDTFVPNDAFLISGAGLGSNVTVSEDYLESDVGDGKREPNSIVVCTGANACGKLPECILETGSIDPIYGTGMSSTYTTLNHFCKVEWADRLADGAGLFCGVLKHLANRGSTCPKVLVATHFHDVFSDDLLCPRSLPITFAHMQVLLATSRGDVLATSDTTGETGCLGSDAGEDEEGEEAGRQISPGERITYLYKVAKGLSLDSHAATCAEIFGIPRRVARRARYVSKLLSMHELGELLDEEMSEAERKELEEAEEVCRRFLAWNLAETGWKDEGKDVRQMLAEVLGR
ncbi:hypothetical protein AcV7_009742 [Taiwanofungus camphoratus]|nr:hypothetical protein AcV7_009742 [Antrodia cinnamomea]